MKIYTKTGDQGETGLFAGPRVRKDDQRIEAYGTVDELNAALGVVRASGVSTEIDELLDRVQNELLAIGAELSTPDPSHHGTQIISEEHIAALESDIDHFETQLAPLKNFILPGGSAPAAFLHLARTVCRRAERRVVTLSFAHVRPAAPRLVQYLNRLSDLLFVLSRTTNAAAGRPDVHWKKP